MKDQQKFIDQLKKSRDPETATKGRGYFIIWANGRGKVGYRHKQDAIDFVDQTDCVSVKYREAEKGERVRNKFTEISARAYKKMKKAWDNPPRDDATYPGSNVSGPVPHSTPKSPGSKPRRDQRTKDDYHAPSQLDRDPIPGDTQPEQGTGGQSHSGEPGRVDNIYPEPSNWLRPLKGLPFTDEHLMHDFNEDFDTDYHQRQRGLNMRRVKKTALNMKKKADIVEEDWEAQYEGALEGTENNADEVYKEADAAFRSNIAQAEKMFVDNYRGDRENWQEIEKELHRIYDQYFIPLLTAEATAGGYTEPINPFPAPNWVWSWLLRWEQDQKNLNLTDEDVKFISDNPKYMQSAGFPENFEIADGYDFGGSDGAFSPALTIVDEQKPFIGATQHQRDTAIITDLDEPIKLPPKSSVFLKDVTPYLTNYDIVVDNIDNALLPGGTAFISSIRTAVDPYIDLLTAKGYQITSDVITEAYGDDEENDRDRSVILTKPGQLSEKALRLNLKKAQKVPKWTDPKFLGSDLYDYVKIALQKYRQQIQEDPALKGKLIDAAIPQYIEQNQDIFIDAGITLPIMLEAIKEAANLLMVDDNTTLDTLAAEQKAVELYPDPRQQTSEIPQMTSEEAKLLDTYTADQIWDIVRNPETANTPEGQAARGLIEKGIIASKLNMKKKAAKNLYSNNDDTFSAKNPNTPLYTLIEFAQDPLLRPYVARNPSISLEMFHQFAADESVEVRGYVATNPKVPIEILERLMLDKSPHVRGYVAYSPNVTPEILRQLYDNSANDIPEKNLPKDYNHVRSQISRSPRTPVDMLIQIFNEEGLPLSQLTNLAHNAHLPAEMLIQLATHPNDTIRKFLVDNVNLPIDALRILVNDENDSVRMGVSLNMNTPPELLQQLCNDSYSPARRYAEMALNDPDEAMRCRLGDLLISPMLKNFRPNEYHKAMEKLQTEVPDAEDLDEETRVLRYEAERLPLPGEEFDLPENLPPGIASKLNMKKQSNDFIGDITNQIIAQWQQTAEAAGTDAVLDAFRDRTEAYNMVMADLKGEGHPEDIAHAVAIQVIDIVPQMLQTRGSKLNMKKAEANPKYDNGSVQTSDVSKTVIDAIEDIQDNIDKDKLYDGENEPGWVENGLQKLFHITVLFGVKDNVGDTIKRAFNKYPTVLVETTGIKYFDTNPDFDVAVVKCKSEELTKIHNELKDTLANEDSYPKYNPHITIAYLKKGERLDDSAQIADTSWEVDTLDISTTDGQLEKISALAVPIRESLDYPHSWRKKKEKKKKKKEVVSPKEKKILQMDSNRLNIKKSSILDEPRASLDPAIWDIGRDNLPALKPDVKIHIVENFLSYISKFGGYIKPEEFVKNMFYTGSTATYTYTDASDIDIHVIIDWIDLAALNPDKARKDPNEMWRELHDIFWWTLNKIKLPGTKHPLTYYVMPPGDEKKLLEAKEEIYDIGHDVFLVPPGKAINLTEEVIDPALEEASEFMARINQHIADARKGVIDYELLREVITPENAADRYIQITEKLREIDNELKALKEEYATLKQKRTDAFEEGDALVGGNSNYSMGNIIFKIVERYHYMDVLRKIKQITDDMDLRPDQVQEIAGALGLDLEEK